MSIELICGDCLVEMKKIPDKSIDLVLTDPPYGIDVQRVNCVANRVDSRTREKISWDNRPIADLSELFRISKNCIIWGANYFNCFTTGGAIVWDKKQPLPDSSQCEIASVTHYKKVFRYEQRWTNFVNTKVTEHPTEKPVNLMKFCINIFKPKTVLDPFMGSGTTGVACKELGRNFIGIEICERYYNIAKRRIDNTMENLF